MIEVDATDLPDLDCVCGECGDADENSPRWFVCAGCARLAPACMGANDDMPEHCDICWGARHPYDPKAAEPAKGPALSATSSEER